MEIQPIKVTYKSTSDIVEANEWLASLPDTIACDFEVATRYTPSERSAMEASLNSDIPEMDKIAIRQALSATALDHPFHCVVTHLSVATSDNEAYVFICDNDKLRNRLFNFLTTTDRKQVWHNLSYDGKHIYFNTRRFPPNYEDTQILAKTLINHTNPLKAKTGLKEIAGHKYGAWGISSDYFDLSSIHDPHVHHYAAIDACATYWIYENLEKRRANETLEPTPGTSPED
jgi:DNA polymerase I-like protein with 3'-5' exonuclease and polymerase domains